MSVLNIRKLIITSSPTFPNQSARWACRGCHGWTDWQSTSIAARTLGGFHSHGGTPSHHPISWDFPWNKPSSYWANPILRNPQLKLWKQHLHNQGKRKYEKYKTNSGGLTQGREKMMMWNPKERPIIWCLLRWTCILYIGWYVYIYIRSHMIEWPGHLVWVCVKLSSIYIRCLMNI